MYGELQNLIQQGRLGQAVMCLENEVLQGREVGLLLKLLPEAQLQGSPLLLKACGLLDFRCGKLNEAKQRFALAVKGLTAQTFHRPLLTAMALWADCLLRTGELSQAETLLQFLSREYGPETRMELDGEVPYALSRGIRLLDGSLQRKPLLLEAFDAFVRDHRQEQAAVAIELLMDGLLNSDSVLEMSVLMHLQKWAASDSRFACYYQWAEAISLLNRGQWEAAVKLLKQLPLEQLPYQLAAAAELQLARTLQTFGEDAALDQLAVLNRLQQSHSADWELQHAIRLAKYEQFQARGDADAAQQARKESEAIADMLQLSYGMKEAGQRIPGLSEPAMPGGSLAVTSVVRAPQAGAPFRIHCFGGLQLLSHGNQAPPVQWKRRKAKELFLYLLLEPNYSAGKEEVTEIVMPGSDPGGVIKHLYVIVHQLKKTLQSCLDIDNGVMIRDDRVRLNEKMIEFVDVEQYLSMIRVADQMWRQDEELSVELYTQAHAIYGKLLPELPYLDWLERHREFLLEKQTMVLSRLGKWAEKDLQYEQAESFYLEWIELRPYQEEAYQKMMRLLMTTGRHKEAGRWYSKLAEMCQLELGTPPTEESKRIVSR